MWCCFPVKPPTIRILVKKGLLEKRKNENVPCVLPSSLKLCLLILQAWYAKTPLGKARIKSLLEAEEAAKGKGKGKGKDKGKGKGKEKGKDKEKKKEKKKGKKKKK